MSRTVDSRVVEMQFDNRHFESNVRTTMSSLDKLKQNLQFKGVEKGFNDLDRSAKKVDMTHLGRGIDTVQAKFSALQVIGTTALVNITNSAMNAGKKIVSALAIDPIKTGFQEYETQMNAVQTILANTASKGSTLKDVNAALDELNTYADKTIYNFTEMTRNIGTFTAAGVDLETSVNAIQGIANLAAVSGSTSQQASTAMYQLSQALASGTVKLMDWNSVVNAGMGGEVFQNALKETSKELKTGAEAAIKAEGSFRESLKTGWLTSEVLTETLKKFTSTGANEYVAEYTGLSKEAVAAALEEAEARYGEAEAIEQASKALAEKSGKNKDEIQSALQFAKTAEDAATKVKTFSQLWDVMKESAQSGWAQTWKLIVGDFEQAKNLLTPLADFFTGIIGKISDARNNLLKGALGKTFTNLGKQISGIMKPVEGTVNAVKNASEALKDYGAVVDKIINGDFGNGKARFEALTKAGYDYAHAQNLVNEKLGSSVRHATDYKEAQTAVNNEQTKLTKSEAKRIAQLTEMSDAELKNLGYTKKQINAFRELKDEADKLGLPVSEFISQLDELNGRTILINSFKNAGQGLVKAITAIKDAWVDVFPPATSDQLYDIIAGLHKFSTNLKMTDETAQKVESTFKGLFAALDIILTIVGGPIKIAFKIFADILESMDLGILDVTASIGDAIYRFNEWLDSVLDFSGAFEFLSGLFKDILSPFEEVKAALEELFPKDNEENAKTLSDNLEKLGDALNISDSAADNFKKVFEGLGSALKGVNYVVSKSLISSIKLLKAVLGLFDMDMADLIANVAEGITKFKEWADEHLLLANSIDKVAKILVALGEGIWNCVKAIGELKVVKDIIDAFGDAWAKLFGDVSKGFESVNIDNFVKNIADAFKSITEWIKSLNDSENLGRDIILGLVNGIKNGVGAVIDAISGVATALIDAFCALLGINSPSTVMMSIGGFIIAGLIAGLITSKGELLGTITDIGGSLLTWFGESVNKLFEWLKSIKWSEIDWPEIKMDHIIAIGGVAALVVTVKKILDIFESFGKGVEGFGKMCSKAGNLMDAFAERINPKKSKFSEAADAVLKMSISVGILAASVYALAQLETGQLWKAVGAVAALAGVVVALAVAAKMVGGVDGSLGKLALTLLGISLAVASLAGAMKMLDFLTEENVGPIAKGVLAVGGVLSAFLLISKIPVNMGSLLGTLVGVSVAMLSMVAVIKLMKDMNANDIQKGFQCITAFALVIGALMAINKIPGGDAAGLGALFVGVGVAMLSMIAVIKIMKDMNTEDIRKGYQCIVAFSLVIAGLMLVNKIPGGDTKGLAATFIGISMALLAMTACVKLLGGMDPAALDQGCTAVMIFGTIIGLLIMVSKTAGNAKGLAATLIGISVAIGVLAGIAVIMSLMSTEGLVKGVGAVTVLGVIMALLINVTKNAQACTGTIVALTVCIGVLATAVILLSRIDFTSLATATGAIGVLMGIMTGLLAVAKTAKSAMGPLLVLTAVVGVLGACLYAIAGLPVESVYAAAVALGGVLLAMSAALAIAAALGPNALLGSAALLVMTGVVAILGTVLKSISDLPVESTMGVTQALCGLLLSLSAALAILTVVGLGGPAALVGIGSLAALVVGLGALLVSIGALTTHFPKIEEFLGKGISMLEQLASGIGSIIGSFISGFASGVADSLPKIGMALSSFMVSVMPFVTGVKMVDESVLKGVGILAASVLALTAADVISGFMSFGQTSFASLGLELSKFMINAQPFLTLASSVDPEALQGVKYLAQAILMLTAADILDGLTSWLTGGSSFSEFANQLKPLGEGLAGFKEGLGEFSGAEIETIKYACEAIKTLAQTANEIPNEGGWAGKIFGENGIGGFGEQIKGVGSNLAGFISGLGTFGSDQLETVKNACEAIKAFATAANEIPNEGGWAAAIFGDNGLGGFGEQIKSAGGSLAGFITGIGTFGPDQLETVKNACNAIKSFATAAGEIPETGWADKLFGSGGLADFADELITVGENLASFVESVGPLGDDSVARITNACNAIKAFASASNEVTGAGDPEKMVDISEDVIDVGENLKEFVETIGPFGEVSMFRIGNAANAIAQFAAASATVPGNIANFVSISESLPTVGSRLKTFIDRIGEFGEESVARVSSACSAIKLFASASMTVPNTDSLAVFGSNIVLFGVRLVKFSTSMANVNVGDISAKINALTNALSNINTSGLDSLESKLKNAGTKGIQSFVKAISSGVPKVKAAATKMVTAYSTSISNVEPKVKTNATKLVTNFVSSITSNTGKVKSAITKLMTTFVNVITSNTSKVKSAATKLMTTFTNAIKSETSKATSAMKAIVKSVATAAGSNVSSFTSAGKSLVTGFANGITLHTYVATNAARNMAKLAASAAKAQLAINSPSKVFMEIGRGVPEGFASGVSNYSGLVVSATKNMGSTVVDTFRSILKINSPSLVMAENGRYIVQGIAEGIRKDMSAEEAMEQKIKNIEAVFKNAIANLEMDMELGDIRQDIYITTHYQTVGQPQIMQMNVNTGTTNVQSQQEIVNLSQSKYDNIVATAGANSDEAKAALLELERENQTLAEMNKTNAENQKQLDEYNRTNFMNGQTAKTDAIVSDVNRRIEDTNTQHRTLQNSQYGTVSQREVLQQNIDNAKALKVLVDEKAKAENDLFYDSTKAYENGAMTPEEYNNARSRYYKSLDEVAAADKDIKQAEMDLIKELKGDSGGGGVGPVKNTFLEKYESAKADPLQHIDFILKTFEDWKANNPKASAEELLRKQTEVNEELMPFYQELLDLADGEYNTALHLIEQIEENSKSRDSYGTKLSDIPGLQSSAERIDRSYSDRIEYTNRLTELSEQIRGSGVDLLNIKREGLKEEQDKIQDDYDMWLEENKNVASEEELLQKQIETNDKKIENMEQQRDLIEQARSIAELNELDPEIISGLVNDSIDLRKSIASLRNENKEANEKLDEIPKTRLAEQIKKAKDALELDKTTVDKELDLWLTANDKTASEIDKIAKQSEAVTKKLELQKKAVDDAEKAWLDAIKIKEDPEEIQKLYNDYLDERSEFGELLNESVSVTGGYYDAQQESIESEISTLEKEYDLWLALNESTATESQKLTKQLEFLNNKLVEQKRQLGVAEAAYNTALANGESPETIRKLYDLVIELKTEMAKTTKESEDASKNLEKSSKSAMKAYYQYLWDYRTGLLEVGLTQEEIEETAAKVAGWSPKVGLNPVTTEVPEDTKRTFSPMGEAITVFGSAVIQNGTEEAKNATSSILGACVETIGGANFEWKTAGEVLVSNLADGITENTNEAVEAANNLVREINNPFASLGDIIMGKADEELSDLGLTVRAVIDWSSIEKSDDPFTNMVLAIARPYTIELVAENASAFAERTMAKDDAASGNEEIVTAVNEVKNEVSGLGDKMENMEVTVDGDTLVGFITPKVDGGLGSIISRKRRGN